MQREGRELKRDESDREREYFTAYQKVGGAV